MPDKTRQELLQPFLEEVSQHLLARKTGRPFTVDGIRRLLREVIQYEHCLASFKIPREDDPIIVSFFDANSCFVRTSNEAGAPQWELRDISSRT
jgi:hypothetical protein